MPWVIFCVLAAAAVGVLINEFAFRGALFRSAEIAFSTGLFAIAIAGGVTILARYRNKIGAAARDLVIWAAIVAAIVAVYWVLG